MLVLDAEICFYKPDKNHQGLPNDLDTQYVLRPALNFGNDLLFSGTIQADKSVDKLIRGQYYKVVIEMPTIDQEAFADSSELVKEGNSFKIQNASKTIGEGKILDFCYE